MHLIFWLVDIILTSNTLCSSLRLEEQHYTDHLEFLLIIVIIIIIIIIIIITVFIQGAFITGKWYSVRPCEM